MAYYVTIRVFYELSDDVDEHEISLILAEFDGKKLNKNVLRGL